MNKFFAVGLLNFLILTSAQAANPDLGIDDSGGGDPLEISAIDYPDPRGLAQAIEFAQTQLEMSPLPDSLKRATQKEMSALQQKGKYLVLPNLIILTPESAPPGYEVPQDIRSFLTLGAKTERKKGAPIYFAERVVQYPVERLAEILLHETLHHTLKSPAADNERITQKIAAGVFNHDLDPRLLTAITTGVYPSKKGVLASEIADFILPKVCLGKVPVDDKLFRYVEYMIQLRYPNEQKTTKESYTTFLNHLSNVFQGACSSGRGTPWFEISNALVLLAKTLNPNAAIKTKDGLPVVCKRFEEKTTIHTLFSIKRKCLEEMTVGEFLLRN